MNLSELQLETPTMRWSITLREPSTGKVLADLNGDRILQTASIGKLVLLGYVGAALLEDPAVGDVRLHKNAVDPVADSGLWQHLDAESLSIRDLTTLVFTSSDNLATNSLVDHFGLAKVQVFGADLGLEDTQLLDIVRKNRGPEHPPALSVASAAELSSFMSRLWTGEVIGGRLSTWFLDGLSKSTDLSMIPAPLALDPLSHAGPHEATGVANKTGTDEGVRADTGVMSLGSSMMAYAAICNYDESAHRDDVLAMMHSIGREMLRAGAG